MTATFLRMIAAVFSAVLATSNLWAQSIPYTSGCHDSSLIEAAMEKDGQRPVFIGRRPAPAYPREQWPGNVITMNDNGYGYNIERDPVSKKLCIRISFKHVKLNSVDNPEIPEWGMKIKKSKNYDEQNKQGINVAGAYKNGARLVFLAQAYGVDSAGNEAPGKAIVVSAMPKMETASVWGIDSDATPDSAFEMVDFRIVTTNFLRFMNSSASQK